MAAGKFLTGVLAAAGGAALGVLMAPEKGTETRRKITTKRDELMDKLDEKFDQLQDNFHNKVEHLLQNLNESTSKTSRRSQEGRQRGQQDDSFDTGQNEQRFGGGNEGVL
jgi:gas vesicle protein